MPANDGTQRKLSSLSLPLQQHAQMSLQQQLDTSGDTSGTVSAVPTTTHSGLSAEFFHCLTQNLLATTAAGANGLPQATDTATTGSSVAAAFGLPLPDVSMMYGNVNLYNLLNLNLLTESQQSQQQSSLLTEYLKQRTMEANARQHQQRQQQQQRQQRPSKEKKRVRKIFDKKCENFFEFKTEDVFDCNYYHGTADYS